MGESHAVQSLGVLVTPEEEHQRIYEVECSAQESKGHPAVTGQGLLILGQMADICL